MPRTAIEIDLQFAQQSINEIERIESRMSAMVLKLTESYNNKFGTNYSVGLFNLRLKSGELTTKLKPGKRGRAAGIKISSEQKAAMQRGRTTSKKKNFVDPDALRKAYPNHLGVVESALKGSKNSARKLVCLSCAGEGTGCKRSGNGYIQTIRECNTITCGNHPYRPYQRQTKED